MPVHSFKLIASTVARRYGDLLLVQQHYPGDSRRYWGLPGGQVEPGEELLAGLGRVVLEETGLTCYARVRPSSWLITRSTSFP